MMKKKIAILCLVLAMSASSFSAMAYDDVSLADGESTSISLVDGLGIIEGTDENNFGVDEYMTRGQFALAAAKMMKFDIATGKMGNSAFADVDIATEEGCAVNLLADTGIIASQTGKYNPTEIITYAEAARILENCLGYGQEIERNGGYPGGVIKVATDLKLASGLKMTTNTQITKKDAARLIYNTLMALPMNSSIEGGYVQYEKDENIFLENLWDVYDMKGIVMGVGETTLDGSSLTETQVSIDGEVMECGVPNMIDYLGYSVKVYYIDDADGSRKVVAVIPRSSDNRELTIQAEDLSVTGNNVRYDENGKTKSQDIADDAQVIYNGRLYSNYQYLSDILNISEGSVKFVSNRGKKAANVIIVNDEKHILVERVDSKNTVIYAANSTEENAVPYLASALSLDYDLQNIYITLDGVPASFEDIQINDVLVVKECTDEGETIPDDIYIDIQRNIAEGTIGALSRENGEMQINGTPYDISKYCTDGFNAGDSGSFAVTKNGKVVGIIATKTSNLKYAYVKSASYDYDKQEAYVKLFTQDGEQKMFVVKDKAVVNGKKCEFKDITSKISEGDFISFRLNNDGYIATMNRPYDASANPDYYSETSFIKNWSKSSVRYIGGIMGRSIVTEDTTIFYVPRYDRDVDSDYRVMTIDDLTNRIYSDITCYDVDRNGRIGALLIKEDIKDTVSKGDSLFFVEKVLQGVNEDDEPIAEVHGFENGEPKTLIFTEDTDCVTYEDGWMNYSGNENFDPGYNSELPGRDLRTGDALQYEINYDGEVGAYRLIFNNYDAINTAGELTYDDPKYYYERWSATGNVTKLDFNDNLYIGFGSIEMRYNDFAVLCALNESERSAYKNSKVNMIDYYRPVKLNQEETYIYVYNVDSDKLEVGTMEDVQKGDTAFVRSKNMGTLNEIMVYDHD
ncbi:MAG: S-layer homology domain-containing protein [bacterium]|nr:S-layer homology domain-containing protein [bacterium]